MCVSVVLPAFVSLSSSLLSSPQAGFDKKVASTYLPQGLQDALDDATPAEPVDPAVYQETAVIQNKQLPGIPIEAMQVGGGLGR